MTISKETEEKLRSMIDTAIKRADNKDVESADEHMEGFRQGVKSLAVSLKDALKINDSNQQEL